MLQQWQQVGGKRSNAVPQIGANDLPLMDSGAFCVKCNWTTSNKKGFLCGTGLKSTACSGYVVNNMAGCPDPDKSPLWFSFTQTCSLSHCVRQTWRVTFYAHFMCRGRAMYCARRARPQRGKVRDLHVGRSVYRTLIAGGEMKECPLNPLCCAVPVSVRSSFLRAQQLLLSLWVWPITSLPKYALVDVWLDSLLEIV